MAEKSELSKRCLYRNTFAHGASAFSREEKCNSLCYHQMVPSKKKLMYIYISFTLGGDYCNGKRRL